MKKNRGFITVEASLVFFVFLIMTMTLLFIFRVFKVEYITQHALDQSNLRIQNFIVEIENISKISDLDNIVPELKYDFEIIKDAKNLSTTFVIKNFLAKNYFEKYLCIKEGDFRKKYSLSEFDFSKSYYNADDDSILLDLVYSFRIPKILGSVFPFKIHQQSVIGNYSNTILEKFDKSSDGLSNDSIWHKRAIHRGKYFIDKLKKEIGGINIQSGYGFDIFKNNSLYQIFSMNIFSDSYCQKQGTDSKLNELAIKNKLIIYIKKMMDNLKNIDKLKNINSENLNLSNNKSYTLNMIIVFPEEAMSFNNILNDIVIDLKNRFGINIEINFREKVF